MPHVWDMSHGRDEAGDICGRMEQRRILLGQDLSQLSVGVLEPCRTHGGERLVQKGNLLARLRMDQRRKKRGIRVSQVKGQVLDVMPNPTQCGNARGSGESAGREGDVDAGEEALGDQVAAGRRGLADSADIRDGEMWQEDVFDVVAPQRGDEKLFSGSHVCLISWGGVCFKEFRKVYLAITMAGALV